MSETTTLTIELPQSLRQRLDHLATATASSESSIAADAISRYIEVEEWQIAEIKKGLRDADADDFASPKEVAAVFARWSNDS